MKPEDAKEKLADESISSPQYIVKQLTVPTSVIVRNRAELDLMFQACRNAVFLESSGVSGWVPDGDLEVTVKVSQKVTRVEP